MIGAFSCPGVNNQLFRLRELRFQINQISIFAVPLLFVFLQLPTGAELFPDAEYAGKDTVWRDLEIGGEEGMPVEMVQGTDLAAEDVVDGCDHEIEVLLPGDESGISGSQIFIFASWIDEATEGLDSSHWIWRLVYIKHPNEGLGFVAVGEVRVIKHDKDLEDDAVIGADRVALAGDFNCDW